MDDDCSDKPVAMEAVQLLHGDVVETRHDHPRQQVNRIPDATSAPESPENGGSRHQDAADRATQHASADGTEMTRAMNDDCRHDAEHKLGHHEPGPTYSFLNCGIHYTHCNKRNARP